MRFRRRRDDPVALPSLDRLSGLIDRAVELVDAVGAGEAPEQPEQPEQIEAPPESRASTGWIAFLSSPYGYRLVDGPGPMPSLGDSVELDGQARRVVKVGPSPLPRDRRRCAYLAGEEPVEAARTSDA
jgi:hypothetical protein